MCKVVIGKKWDKGAIYIGRGSVFGNPWPISAAATRDEVCDKYEDYFHQRLKEDNDFVESVEALVEHVRLSSSPVVLGCFCAPKRCHGETIKRYVEQQLETKATFEHNAGSKS